MSKFCFDWILSHCGRNVIALALQIWCHCRFDVIANVFYHPLCFRHLSWNRVMAWAMRRWMKSWYFDCIFLPFWHVLSFFWNSLHPSPKPVSCVYIFVFMHLLAGPEVAVKDEVIRTNGDVAAGQLLMVTWISKRVTSQTFSISNGSHVIWKNQDWMHLACPMLLKLSTNMINLER